MTIHALEQLGDRHGALLDWLIAARPSVVLHYEPILEFYDRANLLDYLALWYSERRRYLTGFWTALAARRDAGRIEVLAATGRARRRLSRGVGDRLEADDVSAR